MLLGLALASLLFSGAGDRFGRKPVALAGAVGVTIAGLSSALATQFWQLAALRGLVGVFMGIGIGPCVAITGKNGLSLFDLKIYSLKLATSTQNKVILDLPSPQPIVTKFIVF